MLTKEYISELKNAKNNSIANLISQQNEIGSINYILENLGRLPDNFNSNFLFNLLNHSHKKVRLNAVKNIGKLDEKTNFNPLIKLFKTEEDTTIKREIISSLGRQRKSLYHFF